MNVIINLRVAIYYKQVATVSPSYNSLNPMLYLALEIEDHAVTVTVL